MSNLQVPDLYIWSPWIWLLQNLQMSENISHRLAGCWLQSQTYLYTDFFCHQWFWTFFHWLDDGRWDCIEISRHFRGIMFYIAILCAMRYFNDMGYKCNTPEFHILNFKWKKSTQAASKLYYEFRISSIIIGEYINCVFYRYKSTFWVAIFWSDCTSI